MEQLQEKVWYTTSMQQVFIFDMDGVLINSEIPWHRELDAIWPDLIGKDVAVVFPVPVGLTPQGIFEGARQHGSQVTKEKFYRAFEAIAKEVYEEAPITEGTEELAAFLLEKSFKLGIVSSSPLAWIKRVIHRLSFSQEIEYVVSINDRPDLQPKPSPVAYLEAIAHLKGDRTIILEDSNSGIQAAKKAGAFTIGLQTNLLKGYTQHGADAYAQTMEEVIDLVTKFL